MDEVKDTHDEVKAYVLAICEPLCEFPDSASVETSNDEKGVLIKLFARQSDLGRLIGKKGDTVNAVRSLLRAMGSKNNARYSLKIDAIDKTQ